MDITDIVAIVDRFSGRAGAPIKPRADVAPATPDRVARIFDAAFALSAFRGFPYPFPPGPAPCGE